MTRGNGKVAPELPSRQHCQLLEVRPGRWLQVLSLDTAGIDNSLNNSTAWCQETTAVSGLASCFKSAVDNANAENLDKDGRTRQQSKDTIVSKANAKTVVFFLHGVGGSMDIWSSQIDFLISQHIDCKIIAIDFAGHGHSPAPGDVTAYNFIELQQDAVKLFDHFHSQKNIIIGHSYG